MRARMTIDLVNMHTALANAKIAGVLTQSSTEDGAFQRLLYVPLLSVEHADFDAAYALLSCYWIQWLGITHCRLRCEGTHVVACFSFTELDQQAFDALLLSLKQAEMCFS